MISDRDICLLFRQYYRPLCLYALHYLKDPELAEDAVQESFTAFWQKFTDTPDTMVPSERSKSYLYSMVRNRCIDILRRRGREGERLQPEDLSGVITDVQAEERSAIEARLWDAVGRLPRARRELLLMSKRDGLSYEQIAEEKGLSVHTVRNQISRALQALRAEADRILDFLLFFFTLPAV